MPSSASVNLNYCCQHTGLLNVCEILSSVLVLICVSAPAYSFNGVGFALFTSILGVVGSLVFSLLHVMRVVDILAQMNWPMIRIIHAAILSLFFFISMCILASGAANLPSDQRSSHSGYTAAAVFSAVAFASYALDVIETFKRSRDTTTSERIIETSRGDWEAAAGRYS